MIVSTVSHFKQTPAVATEIADKLGAGKPAAFDISAGCAGFGYGLTLAKGMVVEGSAEYVLVIGVERLSRPDRPGGPRDGLPVRRRRGRGRRRPLQGAARSARRSGAPRATSPRPSSRPCRGTTTATERPVEKFPAITQEGQAVFRWAVFEMAKVAQQALDAAGITADDLDVFIPHQANMRIIDSMVKTLKLPEHVTVARDVRDHRQHLGRLDPARDGAAPGDRCRRRAATPRSSSASGRVSSTPRRSLPSPRHTRILRSGTARHTL